MEKHSDKKRHSDKKKHSDKTEKRDDKKEKKDEIKLLSKGPCYICTECLSLVRVPDSLLKVKVIEEKDEDGPYKMEIVYFDCLCGEESIVEENEMDEDEPVE